MNLALDIVDTFVLDRVYSALLPPTSSITTTSPSISTYLMGKEQWDNQVLEMDKMARRWRVLMSGCIRMGRRTSESVWIGDKYMVWIG